MKILKFKIGILFLSFYSLLFINQINAQCNCTDSISNTSVNAEFGSSTSVTGYCKKISGIFTIDHNMEFINSNLDMQLNSSIVINAGVTLTFRNTKATNCPNSWFGVKLLDTTTTFNMLDSSLIAGANSAIDINGGNVIINDSKVINSKTYISNHNKSNITINNSSFSNGGFWGILIDLYSILNLNITNSQISDNAVSIYGQASDLNMNITKCTFKNSFNGIWIINCSNVGTIKQSLFDNMKGYSIVKEVNSGLIIENDTFTNSRGGIWQRNITNGQIKLNNNYFSNLKYGIWLNENSVSAIVNKNKFESIDSTSIMCDGFGTFLSPNLEISENTFNSVYDGILLRNIAKSKIHDNEMLVVKNVGIGLENSHNNTITYNSIEAINYISKYGINLDMSMGNNVNCNISNKSIYGFHSRNTCGNTRLYENRFGSHYDGLFIEMGSFIGIQKHNWNRWLDSTKYSHLGAVNDNSNQTIVGYSKFLVSTNLNTTFHPLNSGNDFFTIDTNFTLTYSKECFRTAPINEERHEDLALMTNISTNSDPYWVTNSWESKRYVYKELKNNLNYLTVDTILSNFYYQNTNSNIGLFYEVERAIRENRLNDANSINTNITTTATYESNLKTIYQYLAQTDTLNSTQLQNLYSIGNQCPNIGGSAVFMARSIYNNNKKCQNTFDAVNCDPISNRESNNYAENFYKISMMPNPVANILHFVNLPKESPLNVEIYNLQGQVVSTRNIITLDGLFDLNMENISNGIYFVRINSSKHNIATEKIVISK